MSNRNRTVKNLLVFLFGYLLFFSVALPWFSIERQSEKDEMIRYRDSIVLLSQENEVSSFLLKCQDLSKDSSVRFSLYESVSGECLFDSIKKEDRTFASSEKVSFTRDRYLGKCCLVSFVLYQDKTAVVKRKVSSGHVLSERFLLIGVFGCGVLSLLVCLLLSLIYKRSLRPLKLQISKLQGLTDINRTIDYDDDLNYLTMVLRDSRHKLRKELEVNHISDQKMNFILDSFSEGLIVIDSSYKVVLINKKALEIFSYERADIQDRHLENLNAPHELEVNFSMVIHSNSSLSFVEKINSRVYQCDINPVDYSWTKGITNERNGASLVLIDITDDYNSGAMKKEFFANASHELKSPLTSILGYLQLIESHTINDPESIDKAICKCVFESKRMNKIISDMLTLSSLESENLKRIEEIPVVQSVETILSSLEPQIREKSLTIIKDFHPFSVKMNAEDFDKLVRNLLDNGIKYNKTGGTLYVTVKDRTFSVRDTGIGISMENQSRVFERFFRVDKARSKKSGDTGLGLAIVKHICNYYDCQISLESALSVGSEFRVVFPEDKNYSA